MLVPAHRRFRAALDRYADGELDGPGARALAVHLLECEDCCRELAMVRTIKASLRRLADAEPPALAAARPRHLTETLPGTGEIPCLHPRDGVRFGAEATRARRRAAGRLVGPMVRPSVRPLAVAAAVLAVATGLLVHQARRSPEPDTVTALVGLARLDSGPVPGVAEGNAARRGQEIRLGAHTVSLVRRMVDGQEVLIAISDRAFAMPADARPASEERDAPMLVRRGDLSIACLSRPTHMLLVGTLPAERLVEIGRRLGPL